MATSFIVLRVIVLLLPFYAISGQQRVVCYFPNWAWYRNEPGKLFPEDIDASLCTHINYAFAVLDENELVLKSSDTWADFDNKFYQRIANLKSVNPNLKVLLSLGGWNDSKFDKYSRLVRDAERRRNFITHAINFLKEHKFDGLDVDWEYPRCWQGNCNAGPTEDKQNYAIWMRELREAFNAESPRLLLTAAVIAGGPVVDQAYDVLSIARDLDFINIMAYDFHSYSDGITGHHAQFKRRLVDTANTVTVMDSASEWVSKGVPRDKLVVGVPAYGKSFKLSDPANNGLGAPTSGPGNQGEITAAIGTLGYYEICTRLKNGWTRTSDPEVGSWAYSNNQWVSYDDLADVIRKAQWVRSEGYGGIMVWDLSTDDIKGTCCSTKLPFMKAIQFGLSGAGNNPENYGCP